MVDAGERGSESKCQWSRGKRLLVLYIWGVMGSEWSHINGGEGFGGLLNVYGTLGSWILVSWIERKVCLRGTAVVDLVVLIDDLDLL